MSDFTKILIRIGIIFVIVFLAAGDYLLADTEHQIRVVIAKGVDKIGLSTSGRYTIANPKNDQELDKGRKLHKSTVGIKNGEIFIGEDSFGVGHIKMISRKDIYVYQNEQKKRYRGTIDIYLDKENKILVVNTVELEDYVRGVLYHEVDHRWPIEALKAQAVAVRSYALYQSKVNRQQSFDVTSDVYSQVYGGRSAETYRTNIAAKRTKDQVLKADGEILPAYYHANCGGHTENVHELWSHKEKLAPLKGLKCPYCRLTSHYRWKENLRLKDIQERLNDKGYRLGLIEEIRILSKNESGRVKKLQLVGRDGKNVTLEGSKFRNIMGVDKIKSNQFDVTMKGYYADFVGKGWGHGVGMCQWGAYQMAKERNSYKKILQFYYPSVTIETIL